LSTFQELTSGKRIPSIQGILLFLFSTPSGKTIMPPFLFLGSFPSWLPAFVAAVMGMSDAAPEDLRAQEAELGVRDAEAGRARDALTDELCAPCIGCAPLPSVEALSTG
jgi:hypothetical protein